MAVVGRGGADGAFGGPVLTILFSDVVGSTELYDSLGDVPARARIAIHDDLARHAVHAHGGRVVKGLGDGAMAVFSSPRAALAAAVSLQRALALRGAQSPAESLEVRIGINTGEVLEEADGDVHGAAVATAARVAARASGGQVLVTDIVARLAGPVPGVAVQPLGPLELKGFEVPVDVCDAQWAPEGEPVVDAPPPPIAPPRPVGRTPLLGRSVELDDLERWMHDALSGTGHLVVVQGEAGIGKTRLAEELSARAVAAGVRVAWGRCADDQGAPPFWPWRQVLAALGVEATELVDAGVPEERFVVFERVVDRLRTVTAGQSAVIVFDDIQWADHASLLLLVHLMKAVPAPPLLVMATFRSTEPGHVPVVLAELARARGAERIELAGLDADDVRHQLTLVSGQEVTEKTAYRVADATGGNPFFVGEIGRSLQGGTWTGLVPSSVRDVIRQRVDRLTPACGELLRVSSVVGRDFTVATVAAMSGMTIDDALTLLDEAIRAGVIEPGRNPGEFRFAHALLLETMAADIPSGQRIELHLAAARSIEVFFAGRLDPHLADLARHWAAAAPAGHEATAATWSERAGEASVRALAYEEAVRHFHTALEVGGRALARLDRIRLQLALARAAYQAGEMAECADACFAAAGLARDVGRPELLAEAALVLEAVSDPDLNARIHEICSEALDRLEETGGHDALRARLLAQASHLALYRGDHRQVVELSRQAIQLAQRTEEDQALVAALRSRQEAFSTPEGREERAAVAELMLAAGERLRDPAVRMWGRLWRIDVLMESGRLAEARGDVDLLAEAVERVGGPMPRWQLTRYRAAVAGGQGRLAEAHAAGREAFEIMKPIDPAAARRTYNGLLVILGHHARLTADQVGGLAEADDPPPFATITTLVGALALVDAERPDEARLRFTRLGPPAAWPIPPFLRIPPLAIGMFVAARLDARDDVAALHELLVPYRGYFGLPGAGKVNFIGPVELPLGIGAAVLGRTEEAIVDLEVALDRSLRAGAPGWATEAMVELAGVLVQRNEPGDCRRAAELLSRATADANVLGMDVLGDRARRLVAGIGS